jgi:hypothetical protein
VVLDEGFSACRPRDGWFPADLLCVFDATVAIMRGMRRLGWMEGDAGAARDRCVNEECGSLGWR